MLIDVLYKEHLDRLLAKRMERLGAKMFYLEHYAYSPPAITITGAPAGVIGQDNFTVEGDKDFVVWYLQGDVRDSAGDIPASIDASIQIRSVGDSWFASPQPFLSVTGTGQRPFPFRVPRLAPMGVTVTVEITNRIAAAHTFRVTFVGARVYYEV